MSKRRIFLAIIVALSLLVAAGCGSNVVDNENGFSDTDNNSEIHVVKDDLGREVEIPEQPRRVLALNSAMMEMIFELGITPVGKVSEYIIPRPEAEGLPEVSFENSPNIETINKLAPDLIIAHVSNHGQIQDALEATGAAVFYIDPSKAEDQLIGRVVLIGEVLNRQKEAAGYMQKIQEKGDELREKFANSPVKTALLIQGGSQTVRAAQSFCFWGRLLSFLGLENIVPEEVAKTTKAGFVNFDIETVIEKDPDALFILQPGFRSAPENGQKEGGGKNAGQNKTGDGDNKQANEGLQKEIGGNKKEQGSKGISPEQLMEMYRNDPLWQQLSAVKNNRIFIVPENVSPGRIKTLEALESMATLLAADEF